MNRMIHSIASDVNLEGGVGVGGGGGGGGRMGQVTELCN